MSFTMQEKREAVERELGYRRRVFERRVANKQMTRELADRQIALFEAIREDYIKAEQGERLF